MIKIGDKWGAMECIKIGSEQQFRELRPGTSEESTMTFYQLRCGCGKEVKVDFTDKPRKSDWRDCGCGAAQLVDDKKTTLAISIPMGLSREVADRSRRDWKGNMSACICALLARGLKEG